MQPFSSGQRRENEKQEEKKPWIIPSKIMALLAQPITAGHD